MTIQFSDDVRNARLDVVETTIGTTPILRIRTGVQPSNCATADAGTVLATITLPTDWANAASGGVKTLLGTWQDLAADATGTAAHFRIYNSGDTVCHMQGSVGQGTGDLQVDNTSFAAGQQFTVTAFTMTEGNA